MQSLLRERSTEPTTNLFKSDAEDDENQQLPTMSLYDLIGNSFP